jgi:hypothetical protein
MEAVLAPPTAPGAQVARPGFATWFTWVRLCLVHILGFLDRPLLSMLAKPVRDQLSITDRRLGLSSGRYFAMFHRVLAIPLAWMADRTNRVRVLASTRALWSAAMSACEMAATRLQLALARMTVGSGQAGAAPSSHANFSAHFPSGSRRTAWRVFGFGPRFGQPLGVATAALVWIAAREPMKGGLGAASDFLRATQPVHSLQLAFCTLIPFCALAVCMCLRLARRIHPQESQETYP